MVTSVFAQDCGYQHSISYNDARQPWTAAGSSAEMILALFEQLTPGRDMRMFKDGYSKAELWCGASRTRKRATEVIKCHSRDETGGMTCWTECGRK